MHFPFSHYESSATGEFVVCVSMPYPMRHAICCLHPFEEHQIDIAMQNEYALFLLQIDFLCTHFCAVFGVVCVSPIPNGDTPIYGNIHGYKI